METEAVDIRNRWSKIKLIFNILVSIIIVSVVIYICYIPFIRYHYLFTWHVVFGAISYLLLMPVSLMIFDQVWFLRFSRKQKSWMHGILIGIATIFAIISVVLDFYRKEVYKPQYNLIHFESPHAITGLISVILMLCANISGLLTFNISWIRKRMSSIRPVIVKLVHNVMGQIAYIIGIISICIIFYTSWFLYYSPYSVSVILTLIIVLTTLFSLINSFVSVFNQTKVILNQ